jgi:hypothetical protein
MDKNDLTNKHLLPVFVILALFVLMAWRGEVAPTDRGLYAPAPAPPCGCDRDDFDREDFHTREEAQACLDYCWTQAGCDAMRTTLRNRMAHIPSPIGRG